MSRSDEDLCRACGGSELSVFYRQPDVPIHSVILLSDRKQAEGYPTGTIELAFCSGCGFIFNRAFEPAKLEYEGSYEGSQAFSRTFDAFHRELAERLIERCELHGKRLLEIGCGNGDFLELLCTLGDNRGIGFEPSSAFPAEEHAGERYRIVRDFFPRPGERVDADFVCCKMTLEHIAEPRELVASIAGTVRRESSQAVFVQVPEAGRIFEQTAFWDIYYEHCGYFSRPSLATLFERCGFAVEEQWTDYDGQYLMQVARPRSESGSAVAHDSVERLREAVATFSERCDAAVEGWRNRIADLTRRGGRAVLWGAGSKAVSFLAATQVGEQIECLVDINPRKQGTFAPGSGHPIVAPQQLKSARPEVVIVMNPIYRDEIAEDLRSIGVQSELWPL